MENKKSQRRNPYEEAPRLHRKLETGAIKEYFEVRKRSMLEEC